MTWRKNLPASSGELAQLMAVVAALGHVGHRAALEVAISKPGNLLHEGDAQACLEVAPEPLGAQHEGHLEKEEGHEEGEQRGERTEALLEQHQLRSHVEHALEQDGQDCHGGRRNGEAGREHGDGEDTTLANQAQQLPARTRLRLAQRGHQLRRARLRDRHALASRLPRATDGDEDRPAQRQALSQLR